MKIKKIWIIILIFLFLGGCEKEVPIKNGETLNESTNNLSEVVEKWVDEKSKSFENVNTPPDEIKCLKDFINYQEETLDFITFNNLSIEKRQTNEDKKEDITYCTVSGNGEYATHEYECIMYYTFFDKGGWILDYAEIINVNFEITNEPDSEYIVNYFNSNPDKILPAYEGMTASALSASPWWEDGIYMATVDFHAERQGSEFWYSMDGNFLCELQYDRNTGEWFSYEEEFFKVVNGTSEGTYETDELLDIFEDFYNNYALTSQAFYGLEGMWLNTLDSAYSSLENAEDVLHFFQYDEDTLLHAQGSVYETFREVEMDLLRNELYIDTSDSTNTIYIDWERNCLAEETMLGISRWHRRTHEINEEEDYSIYY